MITSSIRHDPFPVAVPYGAIYSHGVETVAGCRMLFVSGQVGKAPDGELATDFTAQCRQAILNVESVLRSANMVIADIVKINFYLVRRADMSALVDVREQMLHGVRPAVTTLIVAGLVSNEWLIEVEALAAAARLT
jgi:enamine deaminase RidA (YjgF/YER057c/UK114 family)